MLSCRGRHWLHRQWLWQGVICLYVYAMSQRSFTDSCSLFVRTPFDSSSMILVAEFPILNRDRWALPHWLDYHESLKCPMYIPFHLNKVSTIFSCGSAKYLSKFKIQTFLSFRPFLHDPCSTAHCKSVNNECAPTKSELWTTYFFVDTTSDEDPPTCALMTKRLMFNRSNKMSPPTTAKECRSDNIQRSK